jgi:hypothetical protein
MANPVTMTSECFCTHGTAPCPLAVSSQRTVMIGGYLAATVMDNKPITFAMCSNPANPIVAAATAASLGVLTAMPCNPAIITPWTPGSVSVTVNNHPLLNSTSKLVCTWGGIIQVRSSRALTVVTP